MSQFTVHKTLRLFFFLTNWFYFYTNCEKKISTIKFSVIYSRYRFTSLKLSLTLELISEKEVLFFNLCADRRVSLYSYQTTPLTFTGLVMVFVFVTRYTFRALNVFDALCIFLWYFLMVFFLLQLFVFTTSLIMIEFLCIYLLWWIL